MRDVYANDPEFWDESSDALHTWKLEVIHMALDT